LTISGTYQQLQNQIADEMGDRQDLLSPLGDSNLGLSPIQNAIQSAIALWEREPFYFNEVYDTNWFQTVPGQEFYSTSSNPGDGDIVEIASMAKILFVHINPTLSDPNRYPMTPRTWQYLEATSVNAQVRSPFPTDFSYFGETIRLYPIPAQVSQMTVSGTQRFPNLVNPNDANVWTQDAYDVIRCQARLILAQEVVFDDGMTDKMKRALFGDPETPFMSIQNIGYVPALKAETFRRTGLPRIRPSYF